MSTMHSLQTGEVFNPKLGYIYPRFLQSFHVRATTNGLGQISGDYSSSM